MLFNSGIYIFIFLPLVLAGWFTLTARGMTRAARTFLVLASLFFYGWWNPAYVPLLAVSIGVNFATGSLLTRSAWPQARRKALLAAGILFNVALIGYFKYTDFLLGTLNATLDTHFTLLRIALPLAISFFTFQQIAYLVDSYHGKVGKHGLLDYSLFVVYFPQLIAGPIVHHGEMMPQFKQERRLHFHWHEFSQGLFLFFLGLFKKAALADTFAQWANLGFDGTAELTLLPAWAASLSYTLQLYLDFSGYTDMALGSALMMNIRLPVNFNSPYKATSIQDFWGRWHMTLARFLRDYVYIPLGGNRVDAWKVYRNILIVFAVSGIWHGAGWTFVAWGMLHGLAMAAHRAWKRAGLAMPAILGWFVTFMFINATWVVFRAHTFADALRMLKGMAGLSGVMLPAGLAEQLGFLKDWGVEFGLPFLHIQGNNKMIALITLLLLVVWLGRNSMQLKERFRPDMAHALAMGALAWVALMSLTRAHEFLYFQF